MALIIRKDNNKPGGGHAILEGPGLENVTALVIKNGYSGLFLGADGRWTKTAFASPVEPHPEKADAVLLGPHIVDFIPTDFQVAFQKETGESLGEVFWTDIAPSRNAGAVTSADVIGRRGGAPPLPPKETGEGTGGGTIVTDPPVKAEKDEKKEGQDKKVERDEKDQRKPPILFIALGLAAVALAGSLAWALRPVPKQDDPPPREKVVKLTPEDTVPPKPPAVVPPKPKQAIDPPREPPVSPKPQPQAPSTPVVTPPTPSGSRCPSDPSEAYDSALEKISSDDRTEQRDGERLLKCAQSGGIAEAARKLGRLHVRMAKESGSPQARRDHAKMACDEGDQEGCRMWHATLDR